LGHSADNGLEIKRFHKILCDGGPAPLLLCMKANTASAARFSRAKMLPPGQRVFQIPD
jgi:hypothetical protein